MPQDPFASIAKPIQQDDPFAAIAKPINASAPDPPQHPYLDAAKDVAKGLGESIVGTISGTDDWAAKHLPTWMTTPIGQAATPENSARAVAYAKDLATPTNTAQSIGKGVGSAAQFLVPGAAEEAGAAKLAPVLGKLGARTVTSAIGSGVVNKAQGGSAVTGALAGAGGAVFGAGLKALAAPTAETAMGVRAADRAFNRTPGQAILDETRGIDPGSIAEQAGVKSGGYTDTLNSNALQSNIPVDLQPSRNIADSFLDTAVKRNNPSTIKEIGQIGTQLTNRPTGPIPQMVSADEGLALRRGIDDLQGSWNPNLTRSLSDSAVNGTRQQLATQLEGAIPGYRELNSKISTLIPVAQRAGAADLNAGVLQRVIGKAARPTGAMVGSIAGGTAGYKQDGVRGALIGGGLGLIAPEIATSPTTLMMGARALNSGVIPRYAIPAATGLGLQLDPKKNLAGAIPVDQ